MKFCKPLKTNIWLFLGRNFQIIELTTNDINAMQKLSIF